MEIFKDLPDFEEFYLISSKGRIWSKRRKKFCSLVKKKNGYYQFGLRTKGSKERIWKSIHRIVAETFIPNPNNLPQINHKDGNKANNSVENLEWCTAKENIYHAFKNKLRFPRKREYSNELLEKLFYEFCSLKYSLKEILIRNNIPISNKDFPYKFSNRYLYRYALETNQLNYYFQKRKEYQKLASIRSGKTRRK